MKNSKRRSSQIERYFSIVICLLLAIQLLTVPSHAAEIQENLEKVAFVTAVSAKLEESVEAKRPVDQEPVQVTLSKQVVQKGTSASPVVKVSNEDKLVGAKTYYSSNSKVAIVDTTGKVKVTGTGETVITVAYAGDEEHNPTYGSTVLSVTKNYSSAKKTAQKEFKVSLTIDTVKAGVDVIPKVQIKNETKLLGTRTYHSSNPEVATISDKTGKILIVGEGTTVISVVYSGDGSHNPVMASAILNVKPAMQLDVKQDTILLGSKEIPKVVITNEDGLLGTKTYQSSNPKVATIDAETGKITVVGVGDTIISVIYAGENGKHGPVVASDILRVTKQQKELKKEDQPEANVIITSSSVEKEKDAVPEIKVSNEKELIGAKTYKSSNPKVATIDAKTGKITLVGKGTTMITVIFAGDENHKATIGSIMLTIRPASSSNSGSRSDRSSSGTNSETNSSTDPSKDPSTDPGEDPSKDPSTNPSEDPSKDPSKDPSEDPSKDPSKDPIKDPEEEDTGIKNPTGPTERPSDENNKSDPEEEDSGLTSPTTPVVRPSEPAQSTPSTPNQSEPSTPSTSKDPDEEDSGISAPSGPVNRPTENTAE